MFKIRRAGVSRIDTSIGNILGKFDKALLNPHTGSKARGVSSLSQTSTITERLGGKMVAQETVNKQVYVNNQGTKEFLAKVVEPIVYFTDAAQTNRVIVLPGTLIVVKGNIALIGNHHVDISEEMYIALSLNQ